MEPDTRVLFYAHLQNNLTAEQKVLWEQLVLDKQHDDEISGLLEQYYHRLADEGLQHMPADTSQEIFERITGHKKIRKLAFIKYAAAAAILLCLLFTVLIHQLQKPKGTSDLASAARLINPGKDQAMLILGDGTEIALAQVSIGKLAGTKNSRITKQAGGLITYQTGAAKTTEIHTIKVPKGGKWQLQLADGTKVWLNAQSTLRYPSAFNGNNRTVELSGEAFFEVVHDAKKPFLVKTSGQVIEDLGTSFNVRAYADEQSQSTTLIKGLLAINGNKLIPGEQGTSGNGKFSKQQADTTEVMGWKHNDFVFTDEPITGIMRELSRWYNIEVDYEGNQSAEKFNAVISRNRSIAEVLELLQKTKGVNFKIQGRRVSVLGDN